MMSPYTAVEMIEANHVSSVLSLLSLMMVSMAVSKKSSSGSGQSTAESEALAKKPEPLVEDPERQAVRGKHQVRPLTDEEDGDGVHRLPDGVYGFTTAVCQRDAPLFKKSIYQCYEVHKLADGDVLIIGFVSQEDADKLNAKGSVSIRLFPDRQEGASTLVSVSMADILRHKEHSQRAGKGLELDLLLEA